MKPSATNDDIHRARRDLPLHRLRGDAPGAVAPGRDAPGPPVAPGRDAPGRSREASSHAVVLPTDKDQVRSVIQQQQQQQQQHEVDLDDDDDEEILDINDDDDDDEEILGTQPSFINTPKPALSAANQSNYPAPPNRGGEVPPGNPLPTFKDQAADSVAPSQWLRNYQRATPNRGRGNPLPTFKDQAADSVSPSRRTTPMSEPQAGCGDAGLLPSYKDQARHVHCEEEEIGGAAARKSPAIETQQQPQQQPQQQLEMDASFVPLAQGIPVSQVSDSATTPPVVIPPPPSHPEGTKKHIIWGMVVFGVVIVVAVAAVVGFLVSSSNSNSSNNGSGSTALPQATDYSSTQSPLSTTTVPPPTPPRPATAEPTTHEPTTPSPTRIEQTKLTASDGSAGDSFGIRVAMDGDTMVIGAWKDDTENGNNSGSAYVYTHSGTFWTEQAKLTASDGAADDLFGYSVAVDGDTMLIGTRNDDSYTGSVYVYTRSGTVWTEQTKLTASEGRTNNSFGQSLAIDGDTIVIGAWLDDTENGINSGSAYVYSRSGTAWTEQAKLLASDGAADDDYGTSVAIDGDTIVIGANEEGKDSDSGGRAYVYTFSGTVWTEQAKLAASDGAAGDEFGQSVAIHGDTVVIGAEEDDTENGTNSGSAYVYTRSGTAWTEQAKLTASDGAAGDGFGRSLEINRDNMAIGANQDSKDMNGGGRAYVYTLTGTVWTELAKLAPSDGAENDLFGNTVAMDGGTIVVGAHLDDTENGENSGSAYIFE